MQDKYTKKYKKEDEDYTKYLGFKNKEIEVEINENIKKCYENILTNYLKDRLSNIKQLKEKDKDDLISYIKNITNKLKLSFRDLKDSMNINDYIKVKIIKYKDFTYSKVIEGFVMTKKACSKKMKEKHETPKILLIQNLDLNEYKAKEPFEKKNNSLDLSFIIDEIIKKIDLLDVGIIVVNKGINNMLLESLLKKPNLIIIIHVKPSALQKIARCTNGKIISSFKDLIINKNNDEENTTKSASPIICGTCKLFQISNVNNFKKEKINNINCIEDLSNYNDSSDFKNIIFSKNFKLMSFEGCDSVLFQTLLLSGPDKNDLKEIKYLLKNEIFSTAREYFLQKKMLYCLFCNIPPFPKEKEKNSCKNINSNKDEMELSIQYQNSIARRISNDVSIKNKESLLKQNNLEKVLRSEDSEQLKQISDNYSEKEIERKASESTKNEHNNRNNIILIIKDKIKQNNQKSENNKNIDKKKFDEIITNNFINENYEVTKRRASNYVKRNQIYFQGLENIKSNFNKIANSTNKEKKSYLSSSNETSSRIYDKYYNNDKEISLSLNKKDEIKSLFDKNRNDNQNINNNLLDFEIKKSSSEMIQNKKNQRQVLKYSSNKSIMNLKGLNDEKIDQNIQWKQENTDISNFELDKILSKKIIKNSSYQFGFDTSPIITNKTSFQLIRLTMCKGENKLNNNNNNISKESSQNILKRSSIVDLALTENTLLRSLNFICGDIQDLNLVYYNSDRERDKPLGKLIIDMISEKDNKCNKCKNVMLNHFYYFYSSNFSRIKIEFISNSDSNLEKIIDFINKENADFAKYYSENAQNKEIDYNIDIFNYGYCKVCKQIVTPLVKMPIDLFEYSSAKFFKHLFNNEEIHNRNDEQEFNLLSSIPKCNCNHLSFHDINRIFVTRYGSLKFEYENLIKYNLVSVQNIFDPKSINPITREEITLAQSLEIIRIIQDNFIIERKELNFINKIKEENNLSIFSKKNSETNIIESCLKILNSIIDYLSEDDDSSNNSSKRFSISTIKNNSKINDMDNSKSMNESDFLILQSMQNKNENENTNNSIISSEENNKKELSKCTSLSEKNNFRFIIKNLYKKPLDNNYLIKIGLIKRIYFRIAQMKVIYNKFRTIINKAKILISLELILEDKEKEIKNNSILIQSQNKPDNQNFQNSKDINNKKESDISIKGIVSNNTLDEQKNNINGDLIISKTPKIESIKSNELISISRTEKGIKSILGQLDLNNYNSEQLVHKNNNIINISNTNENEKYVNKTKEESPFQKDPNSKKFDKSNSENILSGIDKKDEMVKDLSTNDMRFIIDKDKNINNEISPETLIKLLIDKYANTFDHKLKYKDINSNIDYTNMLKIIFFYDEQPNDFSSIIEENDLSSIIAYAISSCQYKSFIKDKTNLLDIKRIPQTKETEKMSSKSNNIEIPKKENIEVNNKTENSENNNISINKINPSQIKSDQYLYDTQLLFDSSNINYILNDKKGNNSDLDKKKISQILEAELICTDNNSFRININSLNKNKFKCKVNPSRKISISRQTITNPLSSPVCFSPPNQKSDNSFLIENDLDQIEGKISKFIDEVDSINQGIKNANKSSKLESILKSINMINNSNILNNINVEELLSQNNNSSINNSITQRKKEVLDNFINSFNINKVRKNSDNLIDCIGKMYFTEDLLPQSEIEITIYYPRQFEALRIAYCCAYDDLLISITKSNKWKDVSGGKSKASFYKTKDEKYLFKSISQYEFNMFLKIAFSYFHYLAKYLFHNMPSLLMKILGVYKIRIKKTKDNKSSVENYYLMMMENLNYGFNQEKEKEKIITYDLKGSNINRYITMNQKKEKEKIVLLDNNFKEDFNCEPIPLERNLFGLLLLSVHNDTLFLSKMGIIDYSLLLHIIEDNRMKDNFKHNLIRVGIIDYIRKYTWDKKIEHILKTIINGFNSPTIINPDDYKDRFISAIKSYFIGI